MQNAYQYGREWLLELLDVIEGNYNFLKETLYRELPEIWMSDLQATYLTWIDLGKYIEPQEVEEVVLSKCKLAVDFGSWFGGEKYAGFIRINLATSREVIENTTEVEAGEFVCILGQSGCGKSTLLREIGGPFCMSIYREEL